MKVLITKNSVMTVLLLVPVFLSYQSVAAEAEAVQSNSNLDNFTYPKHTCNNKPSKPITPVKFSSTIGIETYNLETSKYNINVANYNKEIKIYKTCINKYIKNGNQDINTIRQQLNFSLKEARKRQ